MTDNNKKVQTNGQTTGTRTAKNSESLIIRRVVRESFNSMSHDDLHDPEACSDIILFNVDSELDLLNSVRAKGKQFRSPKDLPNDAITLAIAKRDDVALVASADDDMVALKRSKLPLAIYQESGANRGVWQVCEDALELFAVLVERYKPSASERDKKEIFKALKNRLPVIQKCDKPYYAPVENGIYDVLNKKFMSFDKSIVFTAKISTPLNLQATNPYINVPEDGSVWNVEDWFVTLAPEDPEVVDLLWEVVQGACLPLAPRDKMVLLKSDAGCSGKGTLCELIRCLIGKGKTANIPISDFGKEFSLSTLPNACCIITDENDVGIFTQSLGKLKAIITGDTITINQKFIAPFDFSFRGLNVQCFNEMPTVKDKSGSFQRRLLFVDMPSHFFGAGMEKKYIKQRLIKRQEVKEYILKKVLVDMPYRDTFSEPESSKALLKKFILTSNSVDAFAEEFLPQFKWDLVPSTFMYDLYKESYRRWHPNGKSVGRNEFYSELRNYVKKHKDNCEFEWTTSTRTDGRMDCGEPLILEYNLREYMNQRYLNTSDVDKLTRPTLLRDKYEGLKRIIPCGNVVTVTADNQTETN